MQLGTRWAVGDLPPSRLTPTVVLAIHDVEAQLAEVDTNAWRWTLTWLESRPVVTLDDGTTILVSREGTVTVEYERA